MSMSRDRVQFYLPSHKQIEHVKAVTLAANHAFGLSEHEVKTLIINHTLIECRPSQFARFLIIRHMAGGQNVFGCLEAKIVPSREAPPICDVSKNPARSD